MQDNTTQPDQMPPTIGRYKVVEGVGFGAMGAVYRAFDPLIKRTLAIKTIRLDIPRQSPQYRSFIDRFYHEARISGTLSHPNIVTLFDIGEENGVPYLAMEFVDGRTVASLIESGHRFKPEKVINLASQIAAAIDYAHGKGVIHRDIKPSNLILYDEDRVKVTDFGIAKLADSEMTQSGTLLGTPSYMSPEQAMGDKLDGRSDIFSLGVCCFEMLSGEQPFPGNNVTSILYKLVHVDPVEPANLEMNGLVPQKWHEVFGKVLAKKPDDRYQTATAFVQDLEYCLGAWFGALATDDSGVTAVPSVVAATSARDTKDSDAATVIVKAPPAPPLPAPPGEVPATVVMEVVSDLDDPTTVVMKAPPAPPPPRAAAPPLPSTADSSTVVMKAPAPARKPAAPGASAGAQTVVVKAAPPVGKGASTAPAKAAPTAPPRARRPQAPPPPVQNEPEPATVRVDLPPTVRMVGPATEETVTVRVPPALPPKTQPLSAQTSSAPPFPPINPAVETVPPTPATAPPPPRAARVGVPPALVIGGGAGALALGLVAAWLLLRSGGPTPESPPPSLPAVVQSAPPVTAAAPPTTVAAASGVLRVETTPAGAVVNVNGQSQGASPIEMVGLQPGDYEVRVELKGYEPKTQIVTLSDATPQADLKLALTRPAPLMGSADILSTPFGATVLVNGTSVGQTPVLQYRLKPGAHKVEVTREGYEPWTGSLTVEAGKKARVDAILKSLVKATPPPAPVAAAVDTSRVYNNVPSDVDTMARKVSGSSPSYPPELPKMRSGESASVIVAFVVTEEGEVTDAKIATSGGSKLLDDTVLNAVRTWKYSPALKRGVKVKVRITQKQTFLAG
jgi:serine/threonine-protein kinase